MPRDFPSLEHPIVQAPMAGGPSTPALAAAVSNAGGLGFLAAGYKSPDELLADIAETRGLTSAPVGVNLFLVAEAPVDRTGLAAFGSAIEPEARRYNIVLGDPHFDDDALDAKLEIVCHERPSIVSFTFGCPPFEVVQRLHDCDIAEGFAAAAVLAAGARVAQIGTAFMRCPETATSDPYKDALTQSNPTTLTRAFSGRRARGIVNAFVRKYGAQAPSAYPHVHHLTAPVRAAARKAGDADAINLWAGQAHTLAEARPAGELVRRWSIEARTAIEQAQSISHKCETS